MVHVDDRVGRAQRNHQQSIRPNGRHVDDVVAHRARNPNDHHGELQRGRNQGHGHVGDRASRQNSSRKNYGIDTVTQGERCHVIRV